MALSLRTDGAPLCPDESALAVVKFASDRHRYSGEQLANVLTSEGFLCYCDEENRVRLRALCKAGTRSQRRGWHRSHRKWIIRVELAHRERLFCHYFRLDIVVQRETRCAEVRPAFTIRHKTSTNPCRPKQVEHHLETSAQGCHRKTIKLELSSVIIFPLDNRHTSDTFAKCLETQCSGHAFT